MASVTDRILRGYLPGNFDLDKHLLEYPPDQVTDFEKDNLTYILSLITRIPARAERHDSEYVSLKAQYLKNRVRNYRQYLNYAIESGILETDSQYIPGKKSTGYKFTDEFLTRVKSEPIVKYSLVRSESKAREEKNKSTAAKYSYLTNHFNGELSFDYQGAQDLLINTSCTVQQYNYSLVHLDELKEAEYRYSVDGTAHRFHSNLTNLKSDFRQFLTYGNEYLVSVDISNSQPFFSLCLFEPSFYESEGSQFNIHSIFPSISSISFDTIIPLMVRKVLESPVNNDIQQYKELVLLGQLYEYLAREIYDQKGIVYEDRRRLKTDFFRAFYSPNQTIGNPDAHLRRLFKERFPSVYEIFSLIKKKDHRVLPILLQRIESHIIIEQICPHITQLRPHLPIYTLHDNIVTIEGNEGFIEDIMSNDIKRITGFTPTLKVEIWKQD